MRIFYIFDKRSHLGKQLMMSRIWQLNTLNLVEGLMHNPHREANATLSKSVNHHNYLNTKPSHETDDHDITFIPTIETTPHRLTM